MSMSNICPNCQARGGSVDCRLFYITTMGTNWNQVRSTSIYPISSHHVPNHPNTLLLLYLSRFVMTRSLLSLVGPSTLFISLIITGIAPKASCSRASLDVLGDPFFNLDPTSDDYIDAHGLPVDINEYSWGGYAKKRNTAVRATLQHHPRAKHSQLLSRQVAVHHPFQSCSLLIILSR